MKNTTFLAADFVLDNGLYVSPAVQLSGTNAAVEIRTSAETTVKVQRGVDAVKFYDVPYFEQVISSEDAFNVTGGTPGQYVRIACTIAPDVCNILS